MGIAGVLLMQLSTHLFNGVRKGIDEKRAKPYQKSWIDYFGVQENNCR